MKVVILFLGFLALTAATPANLPAARFDDFKVYRLDVADEQKLSELKKLAVDFPLLILTELKGPGDRSDVLIEPKQQQKFEDVLEYLEFKFECIIEDLQSILEQEKGEPTNPSDSQRFIDHERKVLSEQSSYGEPTTPSDPKRGVSSDQTSSVSKSSMDWLNYQRLPVIYDWLDNLAAEKSQLITQYVAGYSYEDRPIKAIKISSKPGNKAIFVESNIHAIEWISSATTTCFIQNLTHSEHDEELKSLLENYDWIFLPVLNPDGHVYSHDVNRLWRKNRKPTGFRNESGICYGTDLNRNFGYQWGVNAYNYDVPCDHWYAGAKSETEPEVLALKNFLDLFRDDYIRMYLAFHSFGNYILLPYGHTKEEFPPNYDKMMKVATAYADAATVPYNTQFKYGASSIVNYPVSGSSKDYAYGVKNIPFTATMELRDKGKYGFFLPKAQILEVCHEVTVGLKAMVKKAQEEGFFD